MRWNTRRFSIGGEVVDEGEELDVQWKFPEVALPPNTIALTKAFHRDNRAKQVFTYAADRVKGLSKTLPFKWSPKYPYHLIIPFQHTKASVVGYVGRHIYKKHGAGRFIQEAPQDYTFNQHLISTHSSKYLFVVESALDALLLNCLGVRNSTPTQKQINLLKVSGKDIVFIPDQKNKEWESMLQVADENDWFVSIPKFGKSRDATDSVGLHGLLHTTEMIMNSIVKDVATARVMLTGSS